MWYLSTYCSHGFFEKTESNLAGAIQFTQYIIVLVDVNTDPEKPKPRSRAKPNNGAPNPKRQRKPPVKKNQSESAR